jgi:hypothetical protein
MLARLNTKQHRYLRVAINCSDAAMTVFFVLSAAYYSQGKANQLVISRFGLAGL